MYNLIILIHELFSWYQVMASTTISICSLVIMVAAISLTVYSFYSIFQKKDNKENDLNVIQRQIRGFALLMVANLVMLLGMMICAGTLLPDFLNMIRS
uniref:Uncharacterized protein n=1 Tax=Marseillevirus LCMAC201 TaxID=2506605 RepID=A0A481YXX5_9VIRU|nr:MAG: uncharacterized protein LCMAC201_03040 [Marseillevirus LCMAC201]